MNKTPVCDVLRHKSIEFGIALIKFHSTVALGGANALALERKGPTMSFFSTATDSDQVSSSPMSIVTILLSRSATSGKL
jgi:hypothetical protein